MTCIHSRPAAATAVLNNNIQAEVECAEPALCDGDKRDIDSSADGASQGHEERHGERRNAPGVLRPSVECENAKKVLM